ncbi:hypothetical protein HDU98_000313 [Podochytrium sp. JEL0797]|nr:hypothetical protein HDU98_000313 [Podochytrium sp. JEL0797]
MSSMCGSMFLHSAICDTILFQGFAPTNGAQYFGGLVLTVCLGVLTMLVDSHRRNHINARKAALARRAAQAEHIIVAPNVEGFIAEPEAAKTSEFIRSDMPSTPENASEDDAYNQFTLAKDPSYSWHVLLKSVLLFVSIFLRYILMLIVMTFNIGLILAACCGLTLGAFLFENGEGDVFLDSCA